MRLRRPGSEPEDGGHGPETDEERRQARKWDHDRPSADPGEEGAAALLFVGLDRFRMGTLWLWCIRRRVLGVAVRGGIG